MGRVKEQIIEREEAAEKEIKEQLKKYQEQFNINWEINQPIVLTTDGGQNYEINVGEITNITDDYIAYNTFKVEKENPMTCTVRKTRVIVMLNKITAIEIPLPAKQPAPLKK